MFFISLLSFTGGSAAYSSGIVTCFFILLQVGQISLSRQTHNLEITGAEPVPATLSYRINTKQKEGK